MSRDDGHEHSTDSERVDTTAHSVTGLTHQLTAPLSLALHALLLRDELECEANYVA